MEVELFLVLWGQPLCFLYPPVQKRTTALDEQQGLRQIRRQALWSSWKLAFGASAQNRENSVQGSSGWARGLCWGLKESRPDSTQILPSELFTPITQTQERAGNRKCLLPGLAEEDKISPVIFQASAGSLRLPREGAHAVRPVQSFELRS